MRLFVPPLPATLKTPFVLMIATVGLIICALSFNSLRTASRQQKEQLAALLQIKEDQTIQLEELSEQLSKEQQNLLTTEELQQSQISDYQEQLKTTQEDLRSEKEATKKAQQALSNLRTQQNTPENLSETSTITPDSALNNPTILPLQQVIETSQAVFSLHWEADSPVWKDLDPPKYEQALTLWQNLATQLALHPSLSQETAQLQLSIAQAQLSQGTVPTATLASIPWEAAGLSSIRPEIETRLWYMASTLAIQQKDYDQAHKYLALCTEALKKEQPDPEAPHRKDYISAMVELLSANLAEQTNPHKALEHYLASIKHLEEITTSQPALVHLRTTLARSYINSSLLSEGSNQIAEMNQLLHQASLELNSLIQQNPKLTLPHKLKAELTLIQAQSQVTLGQKKEVQKSLKTIETALGKAGGDILIDASSAGVRAFQLWETGKITDAVKLMDKAVSTIQELSKEDPKNTEIQYRLAISLWERSAMRVSINDSLKDATKAAKLLVTIINLGAGKREASVRRTLAILYGDIGHIAAESNQDKIAKQYFQQSLKHWQFLHDNWDSGAEYSEGLRWCKQKIRSL